VVRDPGRVAERVADGRTPTPVKVTVTERGKLERDAPFFRCGDTLKLVYCTRESVEEARAHLGEVATVVDGGAPVRMRAVSEDLFRRGVRRLLVEGGGSVLTQFLLEQVADELHLVVAPFFVGDSEARRLVDDGRFAWDSGHRAALLETRPVGDVVLLRYGLSEAARLPAAGRQEQVR
jgi:5-amino-6-(5-phosphoribosylamino)uracil reductase